MANHGVRQAVKGAPQAAPVTAAWFTPCPGRGSTPIWNRRGCSLEILNLTPKGDHLGVARAFCDP